MGKRKHRPDFNYTPPSEVKTYSSRMDPQSKEKSTHSMDRHVHKSLSSIIEAVDNSTKRQGSYFPRHNHNRLNFMKKPRNFSGYQYSRRKLSNHAGASSSHVKNYEQVWLKKVSPQKDIDSSHRKENKEKPVYRQERIRSSSLVAESASTSEEKVVCGLCERSLTRRRHTYGNTISSGDLAVVAVLVCGHVYHADCLEQKTRHEDICDPLCPLCVGKSECASSKCSS